MGFMSGRGVVGGGKRHEGQREKEAKKTKGGTVDKKRQRERRVNEER